MRAGERASPAELKLVEMGEVERVREGRISFQAATASEFTAAVEQILYRKVRAFASAVDARQDTVFEVFTFEPREGGDRRRPRRPDV